MLGLKSKQDKLEERLSIAPFFGLRVNMELERTSFEQEPLSDIVWYGRAIEAAQKLFPRGAYVSINGTLQNDWNKIQKHMDRYSNIKILPGIFQEFAGLKIDDNLDALNQMARVLDGKRLIYDPNPIELDFKTSGLHHISYDYKLGFYVPELREMYKITQKSNNLSAFVKTEQERLKKKNYGL